MAYDPRAAVAYAHQWAYGRNPLYANFENMGGDCTNFISQCLYAGCGVMNYTKDTGWYYRSLQDRAAAWTGVTYLYNFLVRNQGRGPYGREAALGEAVPGDIVQLRFGPGQPYGHSLLVVQAGPHPGPEDVLIATHTYDADWRPLSTYRYYTYRVIKILGARD